jgi:hypothetical protein
MRRDAHVVRGGQTGTTPAAGLREAARFDDSIAFFVDAFDDAYIRRK